MATRQVNEFLELFRTTASTSGCGKMSANTLRCLDCHCQCWYHWCIPCFRKHSAKGIWMQTDFPGYDASSLGLQFFYRVWTWLSQFTAGSSVLLESCKRHHRSTHTNLHYLDHTMGNLATMLLLESRRHVHFSVLQMGCGNDGSADTFLRGCDLRRYSYTTVIRWNRDLVLLASFAGILAAR